MTTAPTPASVAFRNSYPLDISLYNDDQQNVLYITDAPVGHKLHLDISNASGQVITLSATASTPATVASATSYHFAVRFRPDTLSPVFQSYLTYAVATLQGNKPAPLSDTLQLFATETVTALQALQQQGWSIGFGQEPGGTVALYFLNFQSSSPQTLSPGGKISLLFPHALAAEADGARSTRVELNYQHVSLDNNVTQISGTRQSQLTIVNQRGQKNIPLHISFVGANSILNDGKSLNTLTLRITNVQAQNTISLNPAGSNAPTKFVLSFDVSASDAPGDSRTTDWALGTTSQVNAIHMATADPGHWSMTPAPSSSQAQVPEWVLTPQSGKTTLAPYEAVTVTISNILSSLPPGQTNLYIGYENIPGFWDGQFVVPLEKSPLLYRYIKPGVTNIGVGTPTPLTTLEVKGIDYQLSITNLQDHNWGLTNWVDNKLYFQYREDGVYKNNAMWLDSTGHLTVGSISIGTGDTQNQLAVGGAASFGGSTRNAGAEPLEVQGSGAGVSFYDRHGGATGRWVVYSDRTGAQGTETLRFWSGNDKVAITQAGYLGIGTETPHTSLDVRGGDFQICMTNAQDHNWGFVNWTDDKLYFQYREQGFYKNNAMWLDKTGQLTLGGLTMGGNSFQQGINWTGEQDAGLTIAPLVSGNALRIVGGDGGVLAVNAKDVMCWAAYGIVVKGDIWARNKHFRIEHPTKPDAYLVHACLEGPESSVYYRGRAQLSDGRAMIRLPEYFEALTRQEGRTVLLTPEGREPFPLSYERIEDGTFRVYGTVPNGAFSWEVKAVRADVEEVEVEVTKDSIALHW